MSNEEEEFEIIEFVDGELKSGGHILLPKVDHEERLVTRIEAGNDRYRPMQVVRGLFSYHRACYIIEVYHINYLGEIEVASKKLEDLREKQSKIASPAGNFLNDEIEKQENLLKKMEHRIAQIKEVLGQAIMDGGFQRVLCKKRCKVLYKLFLWWKSQSVGDNVKMRANSIKRYKQSALAVKNSELSGRNEVYEYMLTSMDKYLGAQVPKGREAFDKEAKQHSSEFFSSFNAEGFQKEGGTLRDVVVGLSFCCITSESWPTSEEIQKVVNNLVDEAVSVKTIRKHLDSLGLSKFFQEKRGPKK